MNGYIYTMYAGADPGHGWKMNDPIFSKTPTLGACVPNIRRAVKLGDWIFAISGRISGERQFVVGGFQVKEKIDQLAAYKRFPENRLWKDPNGNILGNVIVRSNGTQHPDDNHTNFESRLENYIIGGKPIVLETPRQFERGRTETLSVLSDVFGRQGNRVFDIIGRFRKMDEPQVTQIREWLKSI